MGNGRRSDSGVDRRFVLKGAAVGAAGVWTVPTILSQPAGAQGSTSPARPVRRPADAPPNIVAILLDDMRADEVPFMPNLQKVAAAGLTFTQARQSTPLCNAARAGTLSGRLATGANGHGIISQSSIFSPQEDETFAVWLEDAGYHTAFFGKYFVNLTTPPPPGWDRWRAYRSPNAGNAVGYTVAVADAGVDHGEGEGESVLQMPTPHQERYLAQEVVTFLEEATEPFFAWVCPNSPHWPMEPSKANASKWEDVYWTNRPEWASWVDEDVSAKPSWIQALDAPSPIDLSATNGTERQRLQELADVDDTIGEVWTYLVETGLIDDTVVIISSDNGNHMFEHRVVQLSKNTPYDISAKVPLVLAGAGIDEGSTLDMPVYAAQDVTATAVDIAGADPGTPVDGISLLAIADDPESFTGRGLLGHRSNAEDTVAGMPAADWIVVDQGSGLRKLIRYQGASGSDQFEAYDLDRDPDEVSNWANDADRLAERDQLESALDGLLA